MDIKSFVKGSGGDAQKMVLSFTKGSEGYALVNTLRNAGLTIEKGKEPVTLSVEGVVVALLKEAFSKYQEIADALASCKEESNGEIAAKAK